MAQAKKKNRKGKRSAEETLQRRREVYKLQMRGMTNVAIATVLGVHKNTILHRS